MVKPPIRQVTPQQISTSLFEDTSPQKEQEIGHNESSCMNVDSAISISQNQANNIPGWSFVSPAQ